MQSPDFLIKENDQIQHVSSGEFESEDISSSSQQSYHNTQQKDIVIGGLCSDCKKQKINPNCDINGRKTSLKLPEEHMSKLHPGTQSNNVFLKLRTQNEKQLSAKQDDMILARDVFQNSQGEQKLDTGKMKDKKSFESTGQHNKKVVGSNNQQAVDSDLQDLESSQKPVTFDPRAPHIGGVLGFAHPRFMPVVNQIGENSQNSQRASQKMQNENNANHQPLSCSFKKQSTRKSKFTKSSSRYDEPVSENEVIDSKVQNYLQSPNLPIKANKPIMPQNISYLHTGNKQRARMLHRIRIQDQIIYEDQKEHKENQQGHIQKREHNSRKPSDHQQKEIQVDISLDGLTTMSNAEHIQQPIKNINHQANQNDHIITNFNSQNNHSSNAFNKQSLINQYNSQSQIAENLNNEDFNIFIKDFIQKEGINENELYIDSNLEAVTQIQEDCNPKISSKGSKRKKRKFDRSQGSNWMGSSNSELLCEFPPRNTDDCDQIKSIISSQKQNREKKQSSKNKFGSKEAYQNDLNISSEGSDRDDYQKNRKSKRRNQRNQTIHGPDTPQLPANSNQLKEDQPHNEFLNIANNSKLKKHQTYMSGQNERRNSFNKFTKNYSEDQDQEDSGYISSLNEESLSDQENNKSNTKDSKRSYTKANKENLIGEGLLSTQTVTQELQDSRYGNIHQNSADPKNGQHKENEFGKEMHQNGELRCYSAAQQQPLQNRDKMMMRRVSRFSEPTKGPYRSDQLSNSDDEENNCENLEVIGQGQIFDVVQHQGDEDSRRYRVYQHYLRQQRDKKEKNSSQNKENKKARKSGEEEGCDSSWSSSDFSSSDEDDKQQQKTAKKQTSGCQAKISKMKASICKLFSSKGEEKEGEVENSPGGHRHLTRRKSCQHSCKEQKKIRTKLQEEANKEKEKQDRKKLKRLKKRNTEEELAIQGSDEDGFFDQTIRIIAQNSENNKDIFLFDPDSSYKAAWEVTGLFFIIYQSIIIPFRLCFDSQAEGGFKYMEDSIDISFMVDILIQFNTGFYKRGNIINNRKEIIINYLKTWFFIDFVASFPYFLIEPSTGAEGALEPEDSKNPLYKTPQLLKLMKMARFLKFLRLLRVFKLKQILYKIEEIIMNDTLVGIMNLMKVICVILFIGHWIACVFYQIGASEFESVYHCWLTNGDLQDKPIPDKYIASLYWAFATMTTVGYGDLYPITISEKLFAMLAMLVACGVFAYVVGSIETIVRRSNTIENLFKERILHVNQYLMHQSIDKSTAMQVRRYLECMLEHHKKQKMPMSEVLDMLSKNLQDEVLINIVGRIIRQKRIFVEIFDDRLQSEIIFMLKQKMFNMDDHIFVEGDKHDKFNIHNSVLYNEDNEMQDGNNNQMLDLNGQGLGLFFILQGQIGLFQTKRSRTYITALNPGKVFGEIGFFSGQPRSVTTKSRGFSELMYLSQREFLQLITEKHTHIEKKYVELRATLKNQPRNVKPLFLRCYVCQAKGHISINCEKFDTIKNNLKPRRKGQNQLDQKDDKSMNGSPEMKDKSHNAEQSVKDVIQSSRSSSNANADNNYSLVTETSIKSSEYEDYQHLTDQYELQPTNEATNRINASYQRNKQRSSQNLQQSSSKITVNDEIEADVIKVGQTSQRISKGNSSRQLQLSEESQSRGEVQESDSEEENANTPQEEQKQVQEAITSGPSLNLYTNSNPRSEVTPQDNQTQNKSEYNFANLCQQVGNQTSNTNQTNNDSSTSNSPVRENSLGTDTAQQITQSQKNRRMSQELGDKQPQMYVTQNTLNVPKPKKAKKSKDQKNHELPPNHMDLKQRNTKLQRKITIDIQQLEKSKEGKQESSRMDSQGEPPSLQSSKQQNKDNRLALQNKAKTDKLPPRQSMRKDSPFIEKQSIFQKKPSIRRTQEQSLYSGCSQSHRSRRSRQCSHSSQNQPSSQNQRSDSLGLEQTGPLAKVNDQESFNPATLEIKLTNVSKQSKDLKKKQDNKNSKHS